MIRAEHRIADLRSRKVLIEGWESAYGRSPPKGISRRLMQYALAYHAQAKTYGGLKSAAKRKLFQLARAGSGIASRERSADRGRTAPPGTRLVREWHGRSHTVEATDRGFLYAGKSYRSLSEIAQAITGARWSGPRFFGL